ncbi:unnamed protein product [Pedinophyceae sp. YPF-701]|nr:unnamed protein product [Pedinophyceae sp. YPF-701]
MVWPGGSLVDWDQLPTTDSEIVNACRRDYLQLASSSGSTKGSPADRALALQDSQVRLAWAQVHCSNYSDVVDGAALAEGLISKPDAIVGQSDRYLHELTYIAAVGRFRTGSYSKARRLLQDAAHGGARQMLALLSEVEQRMVNEGLIGMGVVMAAGGVLVGVVAAAVAGARR